MPQYQFGPFELNPQAQRLARHGANVPLKPKVFSLLCHLVEHRDRLLGRDELMDYLWPNQEVPDSNLTQSVYELRRALGDRRDGPHFIETVARRGFRFRAPVVVSEQSAVREQTVSITVLSFVSLPGAQRHEALEHGIAASLIAGLGRIPVLRIRPPPMLERFIEPGRDGLACGQEMGVDIVLDGHLQCAGDRLRVTARLVQTADGVVMWADQFDRPFDDLLDLEDELGLAVARVLAPDRTTQPGQPLLARRTDDPLTHELFLKARYHWQKWTPDGFHRAIECGNAALVRAPHHAGAHVWVGASHSMLAIIGLEPPHAAFAHGESHIRRALELDGQLADAYECRGAIAHFHHWDRAAAERDLRRCLELDHGSQARGLLATLLTVVGRPDEALREAELAREILPLSPMLNASVGEVRLFRREYAAAIEACERCLALDAYFVFARTLLGLAQAALGRHADALETFQTIAAHAGIAAQDSPHVGFALGLLGDRDGALAVNQRLRAASAERYVDPFSQALVNLGLGLHDAACSDLERAFENRSPQLVYLGVNGIFDPLHTDPRFVTLLRRLNLSLQPAAGNG